MKIAYLNSYFQAWKKHNGENVGMLSLFQDFNVSPQMVIREM